MKASKKKRIVFAAFAMMLFCAAVGFPAAAKEDTREGFDEYGFPIVGERIKSKDGCYEYVINQATGDVYFNRALAEKIILNIPDEIDGHKIVGVYGGDTRIQTIVKVNFGKNIREVFGAGLTFSDLLFCQLNLNEGLEVIHINALRQDVFYDRIIFPTTLKEIKPGAIGHNVKLMVFQSDPKISMSTFNQSDSVTEQGKDIYFTGDALNVAEDAFDETWDGMPHGDPNMDVGSNPGNFTIHHKPGAKGFEKFAEHGYTIKEYTHEFWNDPITEIEIVTLSQTILHLQPGEKIRLITAFAPQTVDDDRIFFVSGEPEIASVDMQIGEVKAMKKGTAKVRAIASSGAYTDCVVTVGNTPPPKTVWHRQKFWIIGGAVGLVGITAATVIVVRKRIDARGEEVRQASNAQLFPRKSKPPKA